MILILLLLSIAPVAFFGHLIYKRDFDKEPTGLLVKLFLCGVGSAFLTLFISWILQSIIPFFGYDTEQLNVIELIPYVFIGIALIEEFSKWIFVYKLEYNDQEFNHLYDGIVYAAFVSLGFACLENILYVIPSGAAGISTAISRALLAIPGHLCDGIMMGYYLSMAKLALRNNNPTLSKKNLILSLLVPTIAHGLYDYFLFASISSNNNIFMLLFFGFVVFFFIYASKKVSQLSKNVYNLNPGYVSITQRNNNIVYQQPIINNTYPQQPINNNYNQSVYPQQPMSNNYNQNSYPQQTMNTNYNQGNYPQQSINNQNMYTGSVNNYVPVKYCTNCGNKVIGKFCDNCGKQVN